MEFEEQPAVVVVRRRRRTRRHSRNRSFRRGVFGALILGAFLGFWVSSIPEGLKTYVASFLLPSAGPALPRHVSVAAFVPPEITPPQPSREIYPYSLIPGGIRNAKELRDVFDHDPVLAAHYRDFDFRRARVVHLLEDKTVYVSYRIAGRIYWTTKRVSLHAGEVLITDGVITVRSRCGNQVSDTPRDEVSPGQEPKIALLERPMRFFDPVSPVPPAPNLFDSSFQRPEFPVIVPPAPPLHLATAGPIFGLIYPPSIGVCGPGRPVRKPVYGGPGPAGGPGDHKHKRKGGGCDSGGGTPGTAPEPTSLVLLSTGLGGVFLRYRSRHGAGALGR